MSYELNYIQDIEIKKTIDRFIELKRQKIYNQQIL